MVLIGTITLIGSSVVGTTFIRHLNAHSWRVTRFPLPTNSAKLGWAFGRRSDSLERLCRDAKLRQRPVCDRDVSLLPACVGGQFLRRLVEVLPRFRSKRQAVDIERDISAYLLT